MTANNQTESKPVQAVAITAIGSKFTYQFQHYQGGIDGFISLKAEGGGGAKQLIQSFKGKEIMGVGNNINLNPCQSGKF